MAFAGSDLAGADFSSARCAAVDLRGARLDGLRGIAALEGATIGFDQLVGLAPALAQALGLQVRADGGAGATDARRKPVRRNRNPSTATIVVLRHGPMSSRGGQIPTELTARNEDDTAVADRELPPLYDPRFEHDACGVGFVVDMQGRKSHAIVDQALTAVCCLNHRGAAGAEPDTGDGAGILVQMPDAFYRATVGFELPPAGAYATGIAFVPVDRVDADHRRGREGARRRGLRRARLAGGARRRATCPGASAREQMPAFVQVFVAKNGLAGDELERHVYLARKRIEHETDAYFASLSGRVVVYKGMLTPDQLGEFYPDLRDERFESALALVHSRFSTNTFPSWPLAHPYRMLAHNGEINTVQGNENWMRAREGVMASDVLPGDLERAFPICTPGASDTARFDEALELLNLAGRPLHHAILMMIPEAWENHESMDAPAQGVLPLPRGADGAVGRSGVDRVQRRHGDRRGARPQRPAPVALLGHRRRPRDHGERGRRARHRPGQDREEGPARAGEDLPRRHRRRAASSPTRRSRPTSPREHPYQEWLDAGLVHLDDLPPQFPLVPQHSSAVQQQRMFGYTEEDLRLIIAPMARNAVESLGSMGTDTPVPVLSDRPRMLYEYFKQLFAQVTNPPLDANFEALVTSLNSALGPEGNLLDPTRRVVPPDRVPVADPHQRGAGEAALHRRRRLRGAGLHAVLGVLPLPGRRGRRGPAHGDRQRAHAGERGDRERREPRDPLRPLRRRRERADPRAAHHRGGAPPPRAREDAHARRARRRDGRGARGAPLRVAARATARAASTRTSRSTRSATCAARAC